MITLKMKTQQRMGLLGEPMPEITQLEWVIFCLREKMQQQICYSTGL